MIQSEEDLKRYLEMDKFAYHTDRKHLKLIGDDVMIGANAVVNKSFPDGHCRIAGVPAKIISTKGNVWVNGRNIVEEK